MRYLRNLAAAIALTAVAACGSSPIETQEMPADTKAPAATETIQPTAEQTGPEEGEYMELASSAFGEGDSIPTEYSCDGEDVSPPLSWANPPEGTESFALVMDDPDAPSGTFDHWLLYNIPADRLSLGARVASEAELADGSRHGRNSFGNLEYGGPCPPGETHRYNFRLYALDQELQLEPGASKAQLMEAMNGHILAQAELQGTYSR
ncbi:MAG: YbhB/YbcL family Raf kinase inhibitor-like protein [Anaerolineales bacterium]